MADHDVQEIAALQAQVELLKNQLTQSQKLTALGELVSTTTHEFNNVLMTILNYAKLGMRHKDTANREKCFEKILMAGNRAARITNSILGMARNRSSGIEPTDLVQLVEDTLLLLEREMNKYRITVEKKFQPVPPAMVAGNQIQQVLLNILINARQALPGGGRVAVKVLHDADADTVDLVLRDYGCGIPAEKLPAHLRALLHHQDRPRRQRQRRHRAGAVHVPRHHRGPSRQDPRREHGGPRHRLHLEAAGGPRADRPESVGRCTDRRCGR